MNTLEKIQRLRKRADFIIGECTRLEAIMQNCLQRSAALIQEAETLGAGLLTEHAQRAAEIKSEIAENDAAFMRAFAEIERLKDKRRGFIRFGERILGE